MGISGGYAGSIKNLKRSLKKGSGSFIKTVPVDDSINVRFIEEPDKWYGYYEHYVNESYQPCVDDDCEGCDQNLRRSFRYLANVYSLDESKVIPLKLTKDLANQLLARYEKYKTLLDRDYELSRSGSGMNDTTYMASPEPPSKMNLKRFSPLDLEETLLGQTSVDDADDDDDDDEDDDEPRSTKKVSRTGSKTSKKTVTRKPIKKTAAKKTIRRR
jgi:hypothetical protein